MIDELHIHDAGDIVSDAADMIASVLRSALHARGQASLMVSGGSSPKPLYRALSEIDLDWQNVHIGLVDERWVEPGEVGSNEDFIRENLIRANATKAKFFGLKTSGVSSVAGLAEAEARFARVPHPFDVCVMGMGGDAHTASWFPHASGLGHALDHDNQNLLCSIDATGCEVAGDHLDRISLTLSAVLDAHLVVLFIPGSAKRQVFDAAPARDIEDAPVQVLLRAGHKLHVFASPVSESASS